MGEVSLTTNDGGDGKFKVTLPKPKAGKFLVATATNPDVGASGNTSEFSKPRKVK